MADKSKRKRIYMLDELRGFAILCMILQIFTVTVYANDSNVNIVSADNYESREFNQWKREFWYDQALKELSRRGIK